MKNIEKWEEVYGLLNYWSLKKFANLYLLDVWNFHQNRLSILKPLKTYKNFKSSHMGLEHKVTTICEHLNSFEHAVLGSLLGPAPHRNGDYCIGSNFWKFYLIRTSFTSREPVSLVKVFRLFRSERIFLWCSECGHSKWMYSILSIWQGWRVCDAFLVHKSGKYQHSNVAYCTSNIFIVLDTSQQFSVSLQESLEPIFFPSFFFSASSPHTFYVVKEARLRCHS